MRGFLRMATVILLLCCLPSCVGYVANRADLKQPYKQPTAAEYQSLADKELMISKKWTNVHIHDAHMFASSAYYSAAKGDYASAVKNMKKAVQEATEGAEVEPALIFQGNCMLANFYMRSGELQEALQANSAAEAFFKKHRGMDPYVPLYFVYKQRAEIYREMQRPEEAAKYDALANKLP
jgi:tetratricopeptide (TPR) repeat protein